MVCAAAGRVETWEHAQQRGHASTVAHDSNRSAIKVQRRSTYAALQVCRAAAACCCYRPLAELPVAFRMLQAPLLQGPRTSLRRL